MFVGICLRPRLVGWQLQAITSFLVLALAGYFGRMATPQWAVIAIAFAATGMMFHRPVLGLPLAIVLALLFPVQIGTGTTVRLNAVSLFIPLLGFVWLLSMVRRRSLHLNPSRANLPLFLFVLSSLISLLIGEATWNPTVPRGSNFLLVQLAQWSIFAFSALLFWLSGNLISDESALWRLTWVFLAIGGALAILAAFVDLKRIVGGVATVAMIRTPFWLVLTGLSFGQLLFMPRLSLPRRLFLVAVLAAVLAYSFIVARETISNWAGVVTVMSVLVWLRFPRLRMWMAFAVAVSIVTGALYPAIYEFAGGDTEWIVSGGSRLVLIERTIEVALRNPITGLGPAAYRPYAAVNPLPYLAGLWTTPMVSSHNNYVDLFAHGGLLGMGLFFWFAVELIRVCLGLRKKIKGGFVAGYLNGMLAVWVGALFVMLLADWILPFVYNIGFEGFQASSLLWLFLGGIVAIERMATGVRSLTAE